MNPMVQVTRRRETDRIRKEALKLQEQSVQKLLIGASGHLGGRTRGSDAVPSNPATFALECHAKVVKVPKYGSEGAGPLYPKNDIKAAERDSEAIYLEAFACDVQGQATAEAPAHNLIAVGNLVVESRTQLEHQAGTSYGALANEIMGGAGIKELNEVGGAESNTELHGFVGADTP